LLKILPGNPREPYKAGLAQSRDDDVLLRTVFEPEDGVYMRLYPDGKTLMEGNHRRLELIDRARDPLTTIKWDTKIYIEGWTP
jgi:hypothetical protein